MPQGSLTLVARTGQGALPVGDVNYTLYDETQRAVYSGTISEGSSGISETLMLDAPDRSLSLDPTPEERPYSVYTLEISADGYCNMIVEDLQIFADTASDQFLNLMPLPYDMPPGKSKPTVRFSVGDHALWGDGARTRETPGDFSPRVLSEVIVPEFITVHLGRPTQSAQNVTVSFIDYIKNVASSEIYPTWPEASLRANILAQISLALNRIYTEWYPSRGYRFDITNSTAFDQYFVYGRNVFESVSSITEEIFNTYIRKPGRKEPFYAEYCNGTTVTCPGMSQWGTVELAQNGYTPKQILQFYYGTVELITTDNIQSVQDSYPGSPLRPGSTGPDVQTIQVQLDRIAINYPNIPAVFPDGIYGPDTQAAVRAFQSVARLTADGIVGEATWHSISYYYVAVKRLSELTSEGDLPSYTDFSFPGVLRSGSRGVEVQTLQFFLNFIALYNPSVPTVTVDGRFGASTQNAVRAFQSYYGLSPDGVVGERTWAELVNNYRGTQNVDVPKGSVDTRPYPGTILRYGSRGSNVTYVQNLIHYLHSTFVLLPDPVVDGIYGNTTQSGVVAFQRLFGLSPDGLVGALTWDRLNEIYLAAVEGCIFASDQSALTRPYPGTPLRSGSRGENVRYLQTALGAIRRVLRQIPAISADGIFGSATQSAVIGFQRIFGLSADGIAGEKTWRYLNYLYVAVTDGCLTAPTAVSSQASLPAAALAADTPAVPPEAATPAKSARELKLGSFGRDVLALKVALDRRLPGSLLRTGSHYLFGHSTKCALENFQAENGLPVTGVLDEATRQKLF